jgi:hypothetical protein
MDDRSAKASLKEDPSQIFMVAKVLFECIIILYNSELFLDFQIFAVTGTGKKITLEVG